MPFIVLKFLHIAFMFMGVAPSRPAERLFQISTGCYALGIVLGVAAALSSSIDLTAHWLVTAYALVALLGIHGIRFDRWTKRLGRPSAGATIDTGTPAYLLRAMVVLVALTVYVMVTKVAVF